MQILLRRPLRLLVLISAIGLVTASAASAATVTLSGGTMTFSAAAGESNSVSVDQSGTAVTINDSSNPTTADTAATDAGCTQDDANTVTCPTVTAISITLGDRADDLSNSTSVTVPETVDGGDGNDCDVQGGKGNDVIHGGAGDDCVYGDPSGPGANASGGSDQVFGDAGRDGVRGGAGDDLTSGGEGDDFVIGGPGADHVNGDAGDDEVDGGPGLGTPSDSGDVISGGSGIDTTFYFLDNNPDSTSTVFLSLDDQANDGLAGEGDNLMSDIEDVTPVVDNPANIVGSAGTNFISGTDNNDTIDPAAGNDFVSANSGDDTVNANDGFADRVGCGNGNDTANVDEFDQVSADCETVNRTTRGALATEDKPPAVAWTAPAENAVLGTTAPSTLSVTATDDKGISQVVFLDGERVLCTATAAPYTCAFNPIDADVGSDTLTAIAIDTSQQTATALRTVSVNRFAPAKVSANTTPKRDTTAPFKFKTTGTISLPVGVTSAAGCRGVVGVVIKAGKKTISSRRANVSKTCKYSSKVTFQLPARLHPTTLKVQVRFRGNAVLSAKSAPTRTVKVS